MITGLHPLPTLTSFVGLNMKKRWTLLQFHHEFLTCAQHEDVAAGKRMECRKVHSIDSSGIPLSSLPHLLSFALFFVSPFSLSHVCSSRIQSNRTFILVSAGCINAYIFILFYTSPTCVCAVSPFSGQQEDHVWHQFAWDMTLLCERGAHSSREVRFQHHDD